MVIYVDESISPYLPRALDILEQREPIVRRLSVKPLQDTFQKGIKDVDLIPELGKQSAIWITRDKKILQRSIELKLILSNNIGIIILRPSKKAKHWDMVRIIINAWPEIRNLVSEKKPFAYRLHYDGKMEKVDRIK